MENWTEEFDKKFEFANENIALVRKEDVKQFISTLFKKQAHDNEIMINTLLETKNKDVLDILDKIKQEAEKTNNQDERNGYDHSYAIIKTLLK